MKNFIILLGILFLVGFSCVPPAKFLTPDFEKPATIAILPTVNQTTDVAGGIVFRNLLYKKFLKKKYTRLVPNENVDSLLNLAGITDGGQLAAVTEEELYRILNVDGLLYVELVECTYQSLGVSETRHVKTNLMLKLYPGRKIWEDEREVKAGKSIFDTILNGITNPAGTLSQSAKDLAGEYAAKGLKMWLLAHELKPEMDKIIDISIQTLPKSAPVHRYSVASSTRQNSAGDKALMLAKRNGKAENRKVRSPKPIYRQNRQTYLPVEAFTENYFLVFKAEAMNMNQGDVFRIVRVYNNATRPSGVAQVIKIQGKKVVLKYQMLSELKISALDKLVYEY